MSTAATKKKFGIGVLGVFLSGVAAHGGAFGDDIARHSRVLLRGLGLYSRFVDDVDVLRSLKSGDLVEQAVARATCAAIGKYTEREDAGPLRREAWETSIKQELPTWVMAEDTGSVKGAVETAATALTLGQRNMRAAQLYTQYCF